MTYESGGCNRKGNVTAGSLCTTVQVHRRLDQSPDEQTGTLKGVERDVLRMQSTLSAVSLSMFVDSPQQLLVVHRGSKRVLSTQVSSARSRCLGADGNVLCRLAKSDR